MKQPKSAHGGRLGTTRGMRTESLNHLTREEIDRIFNEAVERQRAKPVPPPYCDDPQRLAAEMREAAEMLKEFEGARRASGTWPHRVVVRVGDVVLRESTRAPETEPEVTP